MKNFGRVILVSPPWPMFNRPSIQLGTLKAHIGRQFPGLAVEARHFFLELAEAIGYPVYSAVSERTWAAEPVYAALLYPDRFAAIERLFRKETSAIPILRRTGFGSLTKRVRSITRRFIADIPWETFGLAGFTVCLCQLSAALYMIRQVRASAPHLPIVIGGSSVAGHTGGDILGAFPEIDFAVIGEGETPLSRLILGLGHGAGIDELAGIPGLICRQPETEEKNETSVPACSQVPDLDELPLPDYHDYFRLIASFGGEKSFFPTLPMELSRGCRWQSRRTGGGKSGCAFCNLNLQWTGYRAKTVQRAVTEVDTLTSAHRTLSVAFTDNLLPAREGEAIFHRIAATGKDLKLFGETRADTSADMLEAMGSAGMSEIQIGIEALSTRLLKRMNKGTVAIRNIEIMKNCEEKGLAHRSNLILRFPGSDSREVDETLRNLSFVLPYRPLQPVGFWLGQHSPVWQEPERFGIRSRFNHPHYACLFPPEVESNVRFLIQSYRGDRVRQRKLWRPVEKELKNWARDYRRLQAGPTADPILSYRDGGDFLIIRHRRTEAEPMTHRLTGTSRAIYLFCRTNRSLRAIARRFSGHEEDELARFLKMMVDKKLMFEERKRFLSLAVHLRSARC